MNPSIQALPEKAGGQENDHYNIEQEGKHLAGQELHSNPFHERSREKWE